MLDLLNAAACLVLLVLMAPIAKAMHHSHYWGQRTAFTIFVVVLGLQVAGPIYDWLPEANYLQTIFNLIGVAVVISARQQIMKIVRLTVGAPIVEGHPLRRASDIEDGSQLARVRGRGTE
jgi:hypothetical protein